MKPQRPHNPNVGDFINNKLREIDNDPAQPPYDSIQEYAYEGEGSTLGSSLSSIDLALTKELNGGDHVVKTKKEKVKISKKQKFEETLKPIDTIDGEKDEKKDEDDETLNNDEDDDDDIDDEDELDVEFLNRLGPKFSKLSSIYSGTDTSNCITNGIDGNHDNDDTKDEQKSKT